MKMKKREGEVFNLFLQVLSKFHLHGESLTQLSGSRTVNEKVFPILLLHAKFIKYPFETFRPLSNAIPNSFKVIGTFMYKRNNKISQFYT